VPSVYTLVHLCLRTFILSVRARVDKEMTMLICPAFESTLQEGTISVFWKHVISWIRSADAQVLIGHGGMLSGQRPIDEIETVPYTISKNHSCVALSAIAKLKSVCGVQHSSLSRDLNVTVHDDVSKLSFIVQVSAHLVIWDSSINTWVLMQAMSNERLTQPASIIQGWGYHCQQCLQGK